jgi:signal transduction histidine kinase
LALLRLDHVVVRYTACCRANGDDPEECDQDLDVIQDSLRRALQEIRAVSAGLGLPQLGNLTLAETLARVVRIHERRTGTRVALSLDNLPEQAPLPVKITLYRLVQEALTNAYRHAGGLGQQVQLKAAEGHLWIEVSDEGPGFDRAQGTNGDEHLGLLGMRERVESLGGLFRVESALGCGTKIIASLSYQTEDGDHE